MSDPVPASRQLPLDTSQLRKLYTQLGSNIPGDATYQTAVSTILRAFVALHLADPDRLAADKEAAQKAKDASDKLAADTLAARHASEQAALPDDPAAKAALDKKHADETAAAERTKALADLDAKQQADRLKFQADQTAERAKLLTPAPVDEPKPSLLNRAGAAIEHGEESVFGRSKQSPPPHSFAGAHWQPPLLDNAVADAVSRG